MYGTLTTRVTGVIGTFAICRLYRFYWPWFSW